jgi:predicted transcriptional regulator
MNTVKNNEQTAATDQQRIDTARRIGTINIVSSLVAKGQVPVDGMQDLYKKVVGIFEAAENNLTISAPATQTALPAPAAQPVAMETAAPIAQAAPAKRGRKPKVKAEVAETAAAPTVAEDVAAEAPVVEAAAEPVVRRRGRPRIERPEVEVLVKDQPAVPVDPTLSRKKNDALFRAKYPPIMSIEDTLLPVGKDGQQMRLIFSEEPVSFLNTRLTRYYGRTFEDYKRIYGLPKSYPSKPPAYVSKMSENAKAAGLGSTIPKVKGAVEGEVATEAKTEAPQAQETVAKAKATPKRKAAETPVAEAQAEAPKATPGKRPRKTRNVVAQAA